MPRLTHIAHDWIRECLSEGATAVDATAGNGHDTVFLADSVGSSGHVYAFDLQPAAIQSTKNRLLELNLSDRTSLIQDSHANLLHHLPDESLISAAMWNLGYLPGSDHSLTTTPESTLASLHAALSRLDKGGILTAIVYRGHPGGATEARMVEDWFKKQSTLGYEIRECLASEKNVTAPQIFGLVRDRT